MKILIPADGGLIGGHLVRSLLDAGAEERLVDPESLDMSDNRCGWEKLFSERGCRDFREDFGVEVHVARYHMSTGQRERGQAVGGGDCSDLWQDRGDQYVWQSFDVSGYGLQTRSFMHVDDCIDGTKLLIDVGASDPLKVGSAELISISDLTDL